MKRYYFVTDSLDKIKALEQDLSERGVSSVQMHVLTNKDAEAEALGVDHTNSFARKNIGRSLLKGFCVGLVIVVALVALTYAFNIPGLRNGLMLALACAIVLGFCTWEGAFLGIQTEDPQYRRYNKYLERGQHLFFVDAEDEQLRSIDSIVSNYQGIRSVGTESPESGWKLGLRRNWRKFTNSAP